MTDRDLVEVVLVRPGGHPARYLFPVRWKEPLLAPVNPRRCFVREVPLGGDAFAEGIEFHSSDEGVVFGRSGDLLSSFPVQGRIRMGPYRASLHGQVDVEVARLLEEAERLLRYSGRSFRSGEWSAPLTLGTWSLGFQEDGSVIRCSVEGTWRFRNELPMYIEKIEERSMELVFSGGHRIPFVWV